jgi:malate permease and related proteins
MVIILLQMFALIGIGLAWAYWRPGGGDPEATRKVLAGAVYNLFLPALVLRVIWHAPIGIDSFKIIAAASAGIVACVVVAMLVCRLFRTPATVAGAIVLAASWPNATYVGLPVLEQTFGPHVTHIAIQYDLFAGTPLLLTLGTLIGVYYSQGGKWQNPLSALLRVPPLWAALAAVALNLVGAPTPVWLDGALRLMSNAVVPLMLLAVGMAMARGLGELKHLPMALPAAAIKLFLMPLVAWAIAVAVGFVGDYRVAVVLEGAMPTMVLGMVIADRHGLDTRVYAAAVTITTLLSFLTLPLWFGWASAL